MLVYLDISTWRGLSIGAVHYYGQLKSYGKSYRQIVLMRKVTPAVVDELTDADGNCSYKVGWETERWRSKRALRQAAIRYFKKHYPIEGALLIEGQSAYAEPQPVLCGPKTVKDAINKLCRQAERCGYWDNEETMGRICNEWEKLIQRFRNGADTA
jgi:hypothetical protein